jgi:hypothetical protein
LTPLEERDKGKGVDWEGNLITLELYQVRSDMKKFVPVLFEPQDEPFIPRPLLGHTHYLLSSEENYNKLYAFLVGGAGVSPGELGSLRELAREKVNPLRFGEARIKKGSLSNLTSEAVFRIPFSL